MKFLFTAGLAFLIGSIFLIMNNCEKLNIEKNGQVVKMRIENLPKSCVGARVRYFVTYRYNDELYDKQTRGDFCEKHHVGELINMKMLEGSKYILYPDESALKNLISFGILGILGMILSITQWKKMRNEK